MDNFVVTFARGFGSGGKEIASCLAKELGIHCYENRILTLASQMAGEPEKDFAKSDEQLRRGYFGALLHKLPVNAQKIVRLVGNVIMAACSCASCRSRSTTSPRMARSSHPSRACRLSICTGRSPWALG